MDNSKRLTVERARRIMLENGVGLKPGIWLPVTGGNECCAAGLLVIDQDGFLDPSEDMMSDLTMFDILHECCTRQIPPCVLAVEKISKHVGVSMSYIYGLDKGFERENSKADEYADIHSLEFSQGLEDGLALSVLPEVNRSDEPLLLSERFDV